jgi:hypothetical protein
MKTLVPIAVLAVCQVASAQGIITTMAGNGFRGFSGDGGPATSALVYGPHDMAVDSTGTI